MDRRTFLATGTFLATTQVAGCSGGGSGGNGGNGDQVVETTSVSMTDSQFDPRNVAVESGATVTWTNDDSTDHTVTAASDNWSLDATVPGGASTSHPFEADGVYDVYCRFHGSADLTGMSMKVAVGDATISDPLGGSSGGGGY
ncbi:plastocyanin/azurin family copper-binding protein [Haloarculaceae archaeon H-GB2-1]|nr:cupredoxin domain-containing protein [Haloarculaceae archaeon H-GB1-1]MEA5388140.1 plastocyanin/azurin family copper-binding protein [Haloarculaceae archaeon H-GB11]MEA5406162.1 plastocyanin/azurin family copper-binding protein [Haloarculaceae archaeon H-GB2-1]